MNFLLYTLHKRPEQKFPQIVFMLMHYAKRCLTTYCDFLVTVTLLLFYVFLL